MSRRIFGVVALLSLLAAAAFAKGKAVFLALKGEGSASVVIDEATKTAYITDGGKGKSSGIQGAELDGERVLDHLLGQSIKRLVITCSHPHSDHMGGLRAAVRSAKIRKFAELVFIDNDYERRAREQQAAGEKVETLRESLATIYRKKWGEGGKPPATYISAFGKNAFEGLARAGAEVVVSNFAYNPKRVGKDIHDESVVTQYDIRDGAASVRMVDFDDASTALVDAWVAGGPPPPKVNVLVVPHHGSANNNISSILDRREKLGLSDVIIPVNLENQYNHPDPEVLLDLLVRFTPEHVFLTGSLKGDNVEVTAAGVQVQGGPERNRERLASFLRQRLDLLQSEAESVLQTLPGRTAERALDLPDGALSEPMLQALAERKLITSKELTLLRRVVRSASALHESLKIVDRGDNRRDVLAVLGQGLDPLRVDRFPDDFTPEPPESGADRFREKLASIEEPDVPEEPQVSRRPRPRPSPGGPGGGGPSMFEQEMTREEVTWGGVMLGNKSHYEGSRPVDLEILAPPSDAEAAIPVIRVHFEDGSAADYPGVTPTELWSAYNFIQPSADLERFGPIPGRAAGLVGAIPREGGRDFAIHPAIIGTHLARAAMRLDIAIRAAGTYGVSVPAGLEDQLWSRFDQYGYQWFDEEARIQVRDGRIEIEPETEPRDCFLRFRVVPTDPDFREESFLNSICQSLDAYRVVERFARVVALLNWYTGTSGKDLTPLPSFVKPVMDEVPAPASLPFTAVFANRASNRVVADSTETPAPDETPDDPGKPEGSNWKTFVIALTLAAVVFWRLVRKA